MMSGRAQRAAGVAQIVLGLAILIVFLRAPYEKTVFEQSRFFFVRYGLRVAFFNGSLALILVGVLSFLGVFSRYYSQDMSNAEKARANLIALAVCSPFWISFFSLIANFARSPMWKVVGAGIFCVFIMMIVDNIKTLRKYSSQGSGGAKRLK